MAEQNPDDVAMDLLAQAEHDESAQSILITTDAALRRRAWRRPWPAPSSTLPRAAIAGASWRRRTAAIIVARDWEEAVGADQPIWPPSTCRS